MIKLFCLSICVIFCIANSISCANASSLNRNNSYSLSLADAKFNLNTNSPLAEGRKDSLNLKMKNPYIAGGIAIFPGVFLHGFGHMYAGKYLTWAWLMIATGVGYYLFDKEDEYIAYEGDDITDKRFTYYEPIHYSALIIFYGSWAYDIIGAPIACILRNKQIKENLSLKPYINRNELGYQTGIQLRYQF